MKLGPIQVATGGRGGYFGTLCVRFIEGIREQESRRHNDQLPSDFSN